MIYKSEYWVIVKISSKENTHYRVFGTWVGGFTGVDSWKMNSGITEVVSSGDTFIFKGYSGSEYHCNKASRRLNLYGNSILDKMIVVSKTMGVTIEVFEGDLNSIMALIQTRGN